MCLGHKLGPTCVCMTYSVLPWQGLMEAWTARESPTAEQQASPVSSSSGSPGGAEGLRARIRASRSEVYCILQVGLPA